MNGKSVFCVLCGGSLKRYDSVKRIVRTEYGKKSRISIERYICGKCGSVRRILPDDIIPYKHYSKQIIFGFMSGKYSSNDILFEDYPSESTIIRWEKQYIFHRL